MEMESEIEKILMSFHKEEMIHQIKSKPELFQDAIELALDNKYPYSWRAAWIICSAMEINDQRLQKYVDGIINSFPDKSDGHQRELLKILYNLELCEDYESRVFDLAVSIWEKVTKQPSVRHNAFKMLVKISKKYPELWNEISFLTQDHFMQTLSPGVRCSIMRMIE
jgi:hypothetical protein